MGRRKSFCFALLLFFVVSVFVGCSIGEDVTGDSSLASRELHYGYGVLKGTLHSHELEDVVGEGKWTHYMLFVNAGGFTYRCAINLFNRQGEILYRSIPFSTLDNSGGIFNLSDGYHSLDRNSTSGALDFIRHPGILKLIKDRPWNTDNLIFNNTEVPAMASLLSNAVKVYVFGEPFHDGTKGMHDIHQNQGNMEGAAFDHLNAAWQDGAVIVEYPNTIKFVDRWIFIGGVWKKVKMPFIVRNRRIFMTRFKVQRDFTYNATGHGYNPVVSTYGYNGFAKTVTRHYGPYNCEQLEVALSASIAKPGKAEIYVKKGSAPTTLSYDAKGTKFVKMYGSGSYYVMVRSQSRMIYVPFGGTGTYIFDWHNWVAKISRK